MMEKNDCLTSMQKGENKLNVNDNVQNLGESKPRYSPKETQQIRKAAVQDVLLAQTDLLRKADKKISLEDTESVRQAMTEFIQNCSNVGIVPNIEGLAARLGQSKAWVYKFLQECPEHPSSRLIDQARLLWASARQGLAERGLLDAAMSIFVLKNSGLNFADKHEVDMAVEPRESRPMWASGLTEDEYRQRIIENIELIDIDGE